MLVDEADSPESGFPFEADARSLATLQCLTTGATPSGRHSESVSSDLCEDRCH